MISASLDQISLTDLLRAIEINQKSAVVTLTSYDFSGKIHFSGGKIAYAQTSPGTHLGEYLIRFDYLTIEQLQELVENQGKNSEGTPLGYLALSQGLITKDELLTVLNAQVLDALATIFNKDKGKVLAEPTPTEISQITLPGLLDTGAVMMEALRRRDEWQRGKVPPDLVVKLAGDPTRYRLSSDEWATIGFIDGIKRARTIALECEMPEEHVYHIIYEHLSTGLLRKVEVPPKDPVIAVYAESKLIQRLLLITLERARYKVILFSEMSKLLELINSRRPDGVILETGQIPEQLQAIRKTPAGRFLPIWGIAQNPFRGLWVRSSRIGYIPKLFSEDVLIKAVSSVRRKI